MRALFVIAAFASLLRIGLAQNNPGVLSVVPPASVTAKAGQTANATLAVTVAAGYHANSNKPADAYLIPLSLTWNPGPLTAVAVIFPKAEIQKLGFSAKPVSVFTGNFNIVTRFRVGNDVSPGAEGIKGKLHYQACDGQSCLPPRTIEITLPVEIVAEDH